MSLGKESNKTDAENFIGIAELFERLALSSSCKFSDFLNFSYVRIN
jgi:hypothetical protein